MAAFAVLGLLLLVAPSIAVGGELGSEVGRCTTEQCVEDLAIKHCFERNTTLDGCRAFLKSLEASPRRASREYRLALAAASGRLAERTTDEAEQELRRKRQTELYRALVSEYPSDFRSLLGLATVTKDRAERIALLKRAVAANPSSTIAVRSLNGMLVDGTPSEQAEAISYMRAAYDRADAPHRWYLASQLHSQLLVLNRRDDAAKFREVVARDMGVPGARDQLKAALRNEQSVGTSKAFDALSTVCEVDAIKILSASDCLDAVSQLSRTLARREVAVSIDKIDILAKAARTAFDVAAEDGDSEAQGQIRKGLVQLRSAGRETPLSLQVEAHVLSALGDPSAGELLQRAIALDPQNGGARLNLGRFFLDHGRPSDAITHLEHAVRLLPSPQNDVARMNLILALRRDGQGKRADTLQEQIGAK